MAKHTETTPAERLAAKREYNAAWRGANREKRRALATACYRAWSPAERMLIGARKRAKKRGMEFSLSEVFVPTHCPVLGIHLAPSTGKGATPASPSLDRIDNSLGYVEGNVLVVSHRANSIKGNATIEELRAIVDFYTQLQARLAA